MAKINKNSGLIPGSTVQEGFLEETKTHRYRMEIASETSSRIYTVSQAKISDEWQCSCPAWKFKKPGQDRNCKHLRSMLPTLESIAREGIEAPEAAAKPAKNPRKPGKKKVIDTWAEYAAELIETENIAGEFETKEFGKVMHAVLVTQGTIDSVLWQGELPSGTEDKTWVRAWLASQGAEEYSWLTKGPDGSFAKRALKQMGLKVPRAKKALKPKAKPKKLTAKKSKTETLSADTTIGILGLLEKVLKAADKNTIANLTITVEYK